MPEQDPNPIIIYGAPRSGTTYLNRILCEDPRIFISRETRIFLWVNASLNDLTRGDRLLFHHRDRFIEQLRATYPDMIRSFYRQLAPEATYWGDKYPHYADREFEGCLDTIVELFPGARFIHIIRDGRDVVSSLIRKRGPSGEAWAEFDAAHGVWKGHVTNGCAFGRSLPPGRYFELRYEDLIRDDVGVAREMFDFLGIDMHPRVVAFCEAQQEERTPLSGPARDLRRGVNVSDWGRIFTVEQQLRSLDRLGDHLIRFGYETEESLTALRSDLESRQAAGGEREGNQALMEIPEPAGDLGDLFWEPYRQRESGRALERIRAAVDQSIPPGATVLVMSKGDEDLVQLGSRSAWHFPQDDEGDYLGYHPRTGEDAITQLETLRARGGAFFLLPSASFWWLEHYQDFGRHLEERYRLLVNQEDACRIYDLGVESKREAS